MSLWDTITRAGHGLLKHAVERLQFRLSTDPIPDHWHEILKRNVPLAASLRPAEQEHLLRVARHMVDEVPFEGCGGLDVDEEIRVTITATAAMLLHRLPFPRFTKLVRVLVYPDTFIPLNASSRHDPDVTESEPSLGEASMGGVVVLSWSAVRENATNHPESGNVVIHEMAHILDAEDGYFDGMPVLDDPDHGPAWAGVLNREFTSHKRAIQADENNLALDDYAATNPAEFFAVATEAYFCSADRLRERLPALYKHLDEFFHPNQVPRQRNAG